MTTPDEVTLTDSNADDDVWVFPTSYPQRRIWFVDQLMTGSAVHNLPVLLRLTGALDVGVLRQALDEVAARQEILRTSFVAVDGEPTQVVSASAVLPLRRVDLRAHDHATREEQALRLAAQERNQPFDLSELPLIRVTLFQLEDADWILSLVVHHIITDGWSMGVLVRELAAAYTAHVTRQPAKLPELPIQYADFAHWQRQRMRGEFLDTHLGYWQRRLSGELPALEVPTDHPRPAVQSTAGARHHFRLPAALTTELREVGNRAGATLFMTLLTGFKALLHHHSGQTDIVLGSAIANRNRTEIEPLIGFFVNTLVLRTDISGNPTLLDLLGRVRESTIEAYAHQDLPFELLVEHLRPDRSLSHTPLFQTMFEFGNAPMPALDLPGVDLSPMRQDRSVAEFDLSLSLTEQDGELHGVLEYCVDLFEAATIRRLAHRYGVLLQDMVDDPHRRLSDLSLLDAADEEILAGVTGAAQAVAGDRNLTELLGAAEAAHSDRIAVACGTQQISYAELGTWARRWAASLVEQGVGPESLVLIRLERSTHLMVAIRAVLASGAAFVPVDPGEPQHRLATILDTARPAAVITDRVLRSGLPDGPWPVLCVDGELFGADPPPSPGPLTPAPQNPAYAVYTSGSTGVPKGAVISHAAAVGYTEAVRDRLNLGPDDRFLQFASPGFDVLIEETLPVWACGGTVVVPRTELFPSYAELTAILADNEVTTVELPTAYWHEWVREMTENGTRPPDTLKLVIIGGERVMPERLAEWSAFGIRLVHVFGLTETTVTSCTFDAGTAVDERLALDLPIGTPLASSRLHVLNGYLAPVPPGVPGELYIAGPAVARGYLNNPALSATRFIADPFSTVPGARMYRTGDRVCVGRDGHLRFRGRLDDQLKIRGFRVEPGEIEAVLRGHPAVADAVLTVVADADLSHLVAHVTVVVPGSLSADDVRGFLRGALPEHMVPSGIDLLDELPLTTNGKVDDAALRRRAHNLSTTAPASGPLPRDGIEARIADIWQELLGVEHIARDTNFFDVGGHSLLAARLQSRLRSALQRDVPLIELFKQPTIATQAAMFAEPEAAGPAEEKGEARATSRRSSAGRQAAERRARQAARARRETDGETR